MEMETDNCKADVNSGIPPCCCPREHAPPTAYPEARFQAVWRRRALQGLKGKSQSGLWTEGDALGLGGGFRCPQQSLPSAI